MFKATENVRRLAAVLIGLLVLPWLVLAHGSMAARPKISPVALPSQLLTRLSVDLNGDARPENVALLACGSSRTIQIQFGNSRSRNVTFTAESARRGFLIPYDIDHDTDLDLIWTAGASDKKTFVVWINDGNANFRVAKDNANYASEISALLNEGDPHDQQSLKVQRNDQRLSASPSSKIALAATRRFACPTTHARLLSFGHECTLQLRFFSYLHKRGPPPVLL